jgi:hypothetical protein
MDWQKILIDGGVLSAIFIIIVFIVGMNRPRWFLNEKDVPADILAAVPPRTPEEFKQAKIAMIPFFIILIGGMVYSTVTFYLQSQPDFVSLWLHAFLIVFIISTSDLVFVDWLVLNTITPKWAVYPGTEGFVGYKDYGFHGRAHLKVLPAQMLGAGVVAAVIMVVGGLLK